MTAPRNTQHEKLAHALTLAAAWEMAQRRERMDTAALDTFCLMTDWAQKEPGGVDAMKQRYPDDYGRLFPGAQAIKEAELNPREVELKAAVYFAIADACAFSAQELSSQLSAEAQSNANNRFGRISGFAGGEVRKKLSRTAIICHWQFITGCRPTGESTCNYETNAFEWPQKYWSRRTFYRRFPPHYLKNIIRQAQREYDAEPDSDSESIEQDFSRLQGYTESGEKADIPGERYCAARKRPRGREQ